MGLGVGGVVSWVGEAGGQGWLRVENLDQPWEQMSSSSSESYIWGSAGDALREATGKGEQGMGGVLNDPADCPQSLLLTEAGEGSER